MTDRFRGLLHSLVLAAVALLAYSNSFSAGFPFDNKQLILQDPRVHSATRENVRLIFAHSYWWPYGESGLFRPVTTLSYLFNYAVLGNLDDPAGYHWFNIIVHITNVLFVYALMRRLTRETWPSFAAAALWAVLPTSTEAVTNIIGRADLLATAGVLGALLMYLKSRDASGLARFGWLAGVMAFTALGVFSKETAIVIAPIIVAYEATWWTPRQSGLSLAASVIPVALPTLVMWLLRSSVLNTGPTAEFAFVDNPMTAAGFWTGRLTAITVIARYLWLIMWPARLSPDYSYAQIPLWNGSAENWLSCIVVAGLTVCALLLFRRRPTAFFLLAFAFITFLPAANLLFTTGTIMGERLIYLPSIGVAGVFALSLFGLGRATGVRLVPAIALALVISALGARTWLRNPDWHDDLKLWTSAVRMAPLSAKAHRALAEALYDADPTHANIDEVIAEAEQSVALLAPLPDQQSSFQSYRQAAGYHLDKANEIRGRTPRSQTPSSDMAARSYERARVLLERSLAILTAGDSRPAQAAGSPSADAYRLLAAAHLGLDHAGPALDAATRARQLDPQQPLAYRLAADALLASDRPDDAAVALMVGSMLTADPALSQDLIGLYRSGLDDAHCAITTTSSEPVLNLQCPLVKAHVCAASAEAIGVNVQLGHRDQAQRTKALAIDNLGCPAAPLNALLPGER